MNEIKHGEVWRFNNTTGLRIDCLVVGIPLAEDWEPHLYRFSVIKSTDIGYNVGGVFTWLVSVSTDDRWEKIANNMLEYETRHMSMYDKLEAILLS